MAGFMRRLTQRVPVLRSSSTGDAYVEAPDLTNSNEVLINSLSGDTANQTCSSVTSVPVSVEPIGAMPCSVDVPACSSEGANSIAASEADECQTTCSRRHRRHRRSRRHRLCRIKCKEVNFMSVMCCIIVIVLVCTSLYEPHWWYVGSSHCQDSQHIPVSYLSVRPFFFEGFFMAEGQQQSSYYYGSAQTDGQLILVNLSFCGFLYAVRL
jgi:hypothetical protein